MRNMLDTQSAIDETLQNGFNTPFMNCRFVAKECCVEVVSKTDVSSLERSV